MPLLLALAAAFASLALLKDLGSIAILLLLTVAALYVGTGRAYFVIGGLLLLAATAALGYVAFDHAQVRIDAWLDPYEDPSGTGYQNPPEHLRHPGGRHHGRGSRPGTAGRRFPPRRRITSSAPWRRSWASAGAAGVCMLYLVLLFAGLRTAVEAPDNYQRLLAALIALLITIQAAVIIAGNLRVIPTTGITLPFVSYGGSSLLVNFLLVGVLLGISSRGSARARQLNPAEALQLRFEAKRNTPTTRTSSRVHVHPAAIDHVAVDECAVGAADVHSAHPRGHIEEGVAPRDRRIRHDDAVGHVPTDGHRACHEDGRTVASPESAGAVTTSRAWRSRTSTQTWRAREPAAPP